MQNSNSRFLRAINLQPVDRVPVWFMRQAGRYLPEYRAVRARAQDFIELCMTPELAAQITIHPLSRYDLDALIIFADILLLPHLMGLKVQFVHQQGPVFHQRIASQADVQSLVNLNADRDLNFLTAAIQQVKGACPLTPLIGFAGSPWTVACYMVEGSASKDFLQIRKLIYQNPSFLTTLLERLTINTIEYLSCQIRAGADVVMLFDTWGGLLAKPEQEQFSLNYLAQIIAAIKARHNIPIIVFAKDSGRSAANLATMGCDAIGLDWTADLRQIRHDLLGKVAIQGNLDPAWLYADRGQLYQQVTKIIQENVKTPGYIFNLGHGIPQDIDPAQIQVVLDAIHNA